MTMLMATTIITVMTVNDNRNNKAHQHANHDKANNSKPNNNTASKAKKNYEANNKKHQQQR
jgi:hypothetical protein